MNATSTEQVIVNEVGPRDGLQNQDRILSPEQRLRLIDSLVAAGIGYVWAANVIKWGES